MRRSLVVVGVLALGVAAPAAAQDSNATFTVGTATAHRGELAYGEIKVPAGVDSGYSIGVAVIHGAKPGKVMTILSGLHGTEYTSVVAAAKLIDQIDPKKLTGTVIVVPLANVASFDQMIVHNNPVDHRAMNGPFPGRMDSTQTFRAVYLLNEDVIKPADFLIDLHGGDIDEDLMPYIYWTRTGDAKADEAQHQLLLNWGQNLIIVQDIDPARPGGTASGIAEGMGKIAVVAEAGHAGVVETADLDLLMNGCLNTMGYLKMIDRKMKPVSNPVYITAGTRIRSDKSQMWFPLVKRTDKVKKDQVLGYTTDFVGRKTAEIKAPHDGMVTFIRTVPSSPRGGTLVNLSVVYDKIPPYTKPTPRGAAPPGGRGRGGGGGE